MKVAEKFISINGEGPRAGELAVFIRFQGCNLCCSYCDTRWANEPDCDYAPLSPEDLLIYILSTGIRNITLTGGEPLLQKDMPLLLSLLAAYPDLRVEIETNGSVDLQPFCGTGRPVFTMDYKLPVSGQEKAMRPENFSLLQKNDTVKFVAGSREDLDRALELIREYHLTERCRVSFSPVFGKIEPAEIVEFMKQNTLNDLNLQLQIHKVIWDPAKRGV